MMNIVLITDEKYALPTRAAIRSVIQNAAGDDPLTVHVVGVELSAETARSFSALGTERATVRVLERDAGFAEITTVHQYVSKAALWKFLLPKLLPDLERVLYLDGDVIVSGNLRELYAMELGNDYAAAVPDFFLMGQDRHQRLGLKIYFNSGVMLLNLSAMRQDGLTARLIEHKRSHADEEFMDQDAFNTVFDGRVRLLPAGYNALLCQRDMPEYGNEADWKILHYALYKPWLDAGVFAAVEFMKYLPPEERAAVPVMNVVFSTDENYALATRTAIRSVLANAAGGQTIAVHVVCDGVTEWTAQKFAAISPAVRVLRVENQYREELNAGSYYSHATYLKFDLPQLLPHLDRVLYLDGDVIVNGDLRELYATDMGDCCLAAAPDAMNEHMSQYIRNRLFINPNRYFSAGVLLMNLAALRREGMTATLTEFVRQRPWLMMVDQDAFNAVLAGRVKYVSPAYNVIVPSHTHPQYAALGGMANWKVLHYASRFKPWKQPGVCGAEFFLRHLSPDDWQWCQYAWQADMHSKMCHLERVANEWRHSRKTARRWSWQSLFYEKQVDGNGVKRKFKFLGLGLFTKRKCQNRRMIRVLGVKFAWHTSCTLGNEPRGHRYLDRAWIEKKSRRLNTPGVTRAKRSPQLIVSLTSFPQRMYDMHYCLYSLLTQKVKPDRVVLWLSPEEFPNREEEVSESVLRLQKLGLEIRWCKDNLKPYNKLVHSLEAFPDDVIVTADDDVYYPEDWLGKLYAAYQRQPELIHCHLVDLIKIDEHGEPLPYPQWGQGHGASARNLLMGFCGVLYPPRVLHPDVTKRELFQKLCPTGDDLWFWAMAALNGRLVNRIENHTPYYIIINQERHQLKNGEKTLMEENFLGGGNERMFRDLTAAYPELLELLRKSGAVETQG